MTAMGYVFRSISDYGPNRIIHKFFSRLPLLELLVFNFVTKTKLLDDFTDNWLVSKIYIFLYLYSMKYFWQYEPFYSYIHIVCLCSMLMDETFFHLKWLTFLQMRIFIGSFYAMVCCSYWIYLYYMLCYWVV